VNTTTKLGGVALAAILVFAGAYAVGQLVGPTGTEPSPMAMTPESGHEGMQPKPAADEHVPAGLQVSEAGYSLKLLSGPAVAGRQTDFAFRIIGPGGLPTTSFRTSHDKLMHLIVVRRDLTGFRHVHPTMDPDGTWRIPFTFAEAGSYRVFADFAPDKHPSLTLGADFPVAGDYRPAALPPAARTATVDGYTVTLDGTLSPGHTSTLTLSVSRDGRPVTDLEPYLAAYGHLVALRAGDLAYLHIHPQGEPGDGHTAAGPAIAFDVEVPTTGAYRLFLDFQHHGQVHTASFTVEEG